LGQISLAAGKPETDIISKEVVERMTPLAGWDNFYVIVGSSAGALIGLQFVVITLIANRPAAPGQEQAGAAFATPTIVHFCVVLLLAAVQSAPWNGASHLAIFWAVLGLFGTVYEIVVARRMRVQAVYAPVFEDWLFHVLLPFAAYVALAASGFAGRVHAHGASFAVATSVLLLLFVGIHNAWDAVTYHVFSKRQGRDEDQ
jgi:hypothetical protein